MAELIIQGGQPLKGVVRLGGAKNASFKQMIAALLCPDETRLLNFSQIADVDITKKIIQSLGGKVYSAGPRSMFIQAENLKKSVVPQDLGQASRASCLFIAPLLARLKKATVPLPGGDKIGKRPLNRHLRGLKALGAKIKIKNQQIIAQADQLTGAKYKFTKNTHTGTETMIMAAVLAKGTTVLKNAAQEPEVDDLIEMLNKMGARIKRLKPRVIEIKGVTKLNPVIHQVMPDRNEAISYAIAALVTKGDLIVENANPNHLTAFLNKLNQANGQYQIDKHGIRFYFKNPLQAVNITTRPHPGYMSDWLPLWSVLATQSEGKSELIEAIFIKRFQYVKALQRMGAEIKYFNPQPKNPDQFYNFNLKDDQPSNQHGIKITGPIPLTGTTVKVNDIRAGATLALAGLTAKGQTVLTQAEQIDRGYENFTGRLQTLGAKIKRIN